MDRYWVGGGSSANWDATGNTNWSATSGGAGNASVPTSADNVIFDGAGGGNSPCTITAGAACLSFTVTSGYTNTITHSNQLDVNDDITLHNGYTIAGSAIIRVVGINPCTITSNGKTWPNNLSLINSVTVTLVGDFVVTGSITCQGAVVLNRTTTESISCGGISINQNLTGTAEIILTGGSWTQTGGRTIANNLTFAGNVTIGALIIYTTGTLKYTSGTIDTTTNSSTLQLNGSMTLETNGITWNIISISPAVTATINSLLTSGTINFTSGNVTFAGTAGFNCNTLTHPIVSAATVTFKNGVTYTINNLFDAHTSRLGSILLFTSDHASLRANILMPNNGNNVCNVLADFRRIDASGGRSICTFGGTVTDCVNVVSYTDYPTSGAAVIGGT